MKNKVESKIDDNLFFLLWHLETIEKFYPCFSTMIKKQ
jgi:hypothetical protein